jgi:hypothetical protein
LTDRFTGSNKPDPGGLDLGYTQNKSEEANCAISVAKGYTREQKESNLHLEDGKGRIGLAPDYFYAEKHMGPDPEEDA